MFNQLKTIFLFHLSPDALDTSFNIHQMLEVARCNSLNHDHQECDNCRDNLGIYDEDEEEYSAYDYRKEIINGVNQLHILALALLSPKEDK